MRPFRSESIYAYECVCGRERESHKPLIDEQWDCRRCGRKQQVHDHRFTADEDDTPKTPYLYRPSAEKEAVDGLE